MKPNLIRFATVAAMAAGMVFAETPVNPPQQPPAGQHMTWQQRRERFRQRMTRELNLSQAQQQQAKAIFGQARESSKPLRQQLRQNHEALTAAIQADNTSQIHTLAAKQANLRSQILEIRSDAMAKFYTTLTPEQRAKAEQMHQRMRQRWELRNAAENNTTR